MSGLLVGDVDAGGMRCSRVTSPGQTQPGAGPARLCETSLPVVSHGGWTCLSVVAWLLRAAGLRVREIVGCGLSVIQ